MINENEKEAEIEKIDYIDTIKIDLGFDMDTKILNIN